MSSVRAQGQMQRILRVFICFDLAYSPETDNGAVLLCDNFALNFFQLSLKPLQFLLSFQSFTFCSCGKVYIVSSQVLQVLYFTWVGFDLFEVLQRPMKKSFCYRQELLLSLFRSLQVWMCVANRDYCCLNQVGLQENWGLLFSWQQWMSELRLTVPPPLPHFTNGRYSKLI